MWFVLENECSQIDLSLLCHFKTVPVNDLKLANAASEGGFISCGHYCDIGSVWVTLVASNA